MAAHTAHDVPCPDPSVHEKQHKLSEQASTAALYVTQAGRASTSESRETPNPLGSDGRLSSKSAAASLRYAKPQELPSFPSHGIAADSAGKAAMLAKDYRMKELWQPEQSLAGSKAALLAHGKGGKVELWEASASADGQSAATLAMQNKTLIPNPNYGVTSEDKSKALLAATMSHNKGRQRAGSTPTPAHPAYPDSQNSAANALNAATVSHRNKAAPDGWDSEANQAARIKNLGNAMSRDMFGEHPPVEIEREEAKHNAALHASAISMAKQIYESQNRTVMAADPADLAGAQAAAARNSASVQPDLKQEAMRYINLQETAHKLAAERLAKVDKNFEASRYREYYGYEDKPKTLSSRLSLRSGGGSGGRQHARASSEGTANLDDSDDEEQARRIRSQMSQLNSGLSKVDERKQQDDRAKLLAAAEKRVSARMHIMDEKVFADTGKVPPALMEEWEEKARERAQREREQQVLNPGKTHIGGGKFMDQAEIEAIAAARLKPTLDEINDTAERKRARDEELRIEKEEQERQKREDKLRNKEEKEEQKRARNEEKAAVKKDKDDEKARKSEEKRLVKEEKRKSRDIKRDEAKDAAVAGAAGATLAEVADKVHEEDEPERNEGGDGVQKHLSALNRLKEKFRKSHSGEAEPEHQERPTSIESTTAGVATGATIAEVGASSHDTQPSTLDSQQAAHAVDHVEAEKTSILPEPVAAETEHEPLHDVAPASAEGSVLAGKAFEDDNRQPVGVVAAAAATAPVVHVVDEDGDLDTPGSERPPFEQTPSLSGYHNDTLPTRVTSGKPNLERHISQIPESDDDESDDADLSEERIAPLPRSLGEEKAKTVAERVGAAPVVERSGQSPLVAEESTRDASAQLDDVHADRQKSLSSALDTPGVAKSIPITDPVTTDPDIQLQTDDDKKDHSILRQVLNPHGQKYDEQAYGTTAHAVTVASHDHPGQDVGAAAKQDVAEPSKLKKKDASYPLESKQHAGDDRDKERKGIRGFLSKLRNKEPKTGQQSVAADANDVTAKSTTTPKQTSATTEVSSTLPTVDATPGLGEHVGTDGVIGDSEHVSGLSGNPRADSPSSFRRGVAQTHDADDVSSSGQDEDDVSRGRAGRLAGKLGLGSRKGKGQASDDARVGERQNSGTEDEQFEEARDHFDETLAPPPAFAGQAKSESPVRETRFQEQL